MIDSKTVKKSTPAGIILFSDWFDKNRELFTKVVYKSKSSGKPNLESMTGFTKVLTTILYKVDKKTYSSGVKEFLTDYIKYAPGKLKQSMEKQKQNKEVSN